MRCALENASPAAGMTGLDPSGVSGSREVNVSLALSAVIVEARDVRVHTIERRRLNAGVEVGRLTDMASCRHPSRSSIFTNDMRPEAKPCSSTRRDRPSIWTIKNRGSVGIGGGGAGSKVGATEGRGLRGADGDCAQYLCLHEDPTPHARRECYSLHFMRALATR